MNLQMVPISGEMIVLGVAIAYKYPILWVNMGYVRK